MNNDNNFNIENKFINYGSPKKKKKKKFILILLLILLLGILGYLIYANKIAKEDQNHGNSDYEEYDPNYEVSNSNDNITSNNISNSNTTENETSNITDGITSNINITSNIITSNNNTTSNKKSNTTSNNTSKNIAVTGISLNKTSVSMVEGTSTTISATITPSNATNKNVTWSSSNTNVATVSNGKITAKSAGTTTITVTTKDGNKKATCKVTVTKNKIPVTGGHWVIERIDTYVGYTFNLNGKYVIEPSNATDQSIKWSVSNSSIVSIDGSIIKGLKSGDAVVYGKLSNGDSISRAVYVRNNPGNYAINMDRISYGHGGATTYIYSMEVTKNGTKITDFKYLTYNGFKITPSDMANICMNTTKCSIDTSVHYGTLYDENGYLVGQVRINYNF